MENASKALLIAGGILFAIIVLSIFALAYSNITMMKQAELDEQLKKEIQEFNTPFLAFNKKAMYGTDIISILNLAISSNSIYNVDYGEDYFVNVSFQLTQDSVMDKVYKFELQGNGSYKVTNVTYQLDSDSLLQDEDEFKEIVKDFYNGTEYSLKDDLDELITFLVTAEQNEETKKIPLRYIDQKIPEVYYIKYSGIADFKRKTFKCSEVNYDDNGRVNEIKFRQIKKSTYGTWDDGG